MYVTTPQQTTATVHIQIQIQIQFQFQFLWKLFRVAERHDFSARNTVQYSTAPYRTALLLTAPVRIVDLCCEDNRAYYYLLVPYVL